MWQHDLLDRLKSIVDSDQAIVSLRTFGSVAEDTTDGWSDLDVELTIEPARFEDYFPATGWLESLGDIYTLSQNTHKHGSTTRIVFRDLHRLDVLIKKQGSVPVQRKALTPSSDLTSELESMTREFQFVAVLATTKVIRNDLLIGAHLMLGLERDVLVLAMMLRDRALGTTVHRVGGPYNEAVGLVGGTNSDASSILERIGRAIDGFDSLAQQLEPDWEGDWQPLRELLARARREIGPS
jgi:predicted nucleotidyltransferase